MRQEKAGREIGLFFRFVSKRVVIEGAVAGKVGSMICRR
jgi:hypothetical protein